ncbi:type 1 glutamine amidotransferase, partial [Enterococcus sp.]
GPGAIMDWAKTYGHEVFIYHPYHFNGVLPLADETDFLVILGGPMSPNDPLPWISEERSLILALIKQNKPIFGACYGAQQIVKALGYAVTKAPHKEVGWAPVYLESSVIPQLPDQMTVLHWHEEMFEIPNDAQRLFRSDLVANQGFILNQRIIGLQFHFEPLVENVREMVINDGAYAADSKNALQQDPAAILMQEVPAENKRILYRLLDFITDTPSVI